MKKIFLGLAMIFGTLAFAQYQNNNWGNNGSYYENDNGYYDDDYYFPDNYYYDYPSDYYSDGYYQSYYNDYRNSIVMINWDRFFQRYRLTRWQIEQIMLLNDMFASFSSWNSYYRYNPDRWYYDRFYNLRRILGPQIFIVFQNNYYRGYDPIVYFQNYRQDYYVPRYHVSPRYVNVNINIYKINRNRFYDTHGNKYGWSQTRNPHNPARFTDGYNLGNGGFRNPQNNGGFKNQTNGLRNQNDGELRTRSNNRGFRTDSDNNSGTRSIRNNDNRSIQSAQTPRSNNGMRNATPQRTNSDNFETPRNVDRNRISTRNNEGFRNETQNQRSVSPRMESPQRSNNEFRNNSGNQRNSSPRVESQQRSVQENNSSGNRGGFRARLTDN